MKANPKPAATMAMVQSSRSPPKRRRASYALLVKNIVRIAGELAVHSMNVVLAIKSLTGKPRSFAKSMLTMNSYNHLFCKKRLHVRSVIDFLARQGINDDFEVSGKQQLPQFYRAGVAKS